MKYYCKNCGCEVTPGNPDERSAALEIVCPWCGRKILSIFPARETVAQWEKRKGSKYPDTAPVYMRGKDGQAYEEWYLTNAGSRYFNSSMYHAIAATEAGAPPDDWRPGPK